MTLRPNPVFHCTKLKSVTDTNLTHTSHLLRIQYLQIVLPSIGKNDQRNIYNFKNDTALQTASSYCVDAFAKRYKFSSVPVAFRQDNYEHSDTDGLVRVASSRQKLVY